MVRFSKKDALGTGSDPFILSVHYAALEHCKTPTKCRASQVLLTGENCSHTMQFQSLHSSRIQHTAAGNKRFFALAGAAAVQGNCSELMGVVAKGRFLNMLKRMCTLFYWRKGSIQPTAKRSSASKFIEVRDIWKGTRNASVAGHC